MELDYDRGFSQGQYNGNIAGEIWRTSGDRERRAYGFSYDAPSRLTKADFTQYTSGTWNTSAGVDYTTSGITYDPNGNLITMKQMGLISTSSSVVDSLHYYYRNGGISNQLDNVTDNGGTSVVLGDFKDTHSGSGDYAYDLNGNLTKDLNKGISSIGSNHLNLPDLIKVTGKGTIKFVYDALGNKLRKIVTDSTATPVRITTTDYLGSFIYQNDTLQFFPTEEGRVRYVPAHGSTPAAYVYDYFIRDHLGNTRVVLTEQTDFSQYLATMEPQSAQTEEALFSNLESTREARPPDYPSDGLTSPNTSVARLNGRDPGKRVGPSIILKVMAGDTLQAAVRAFYREKPNARNNTGLPAEQMAGSLLQALALPSAAALQTHAGTPQARLSGTGPGFSGSDLQALKDKDPEARKLDKPKAYLNYVFFDKQLNFVEEGSGVKQLQGDPGQLEALASGKVVARKSGYVYVFTSNESTQDVLFDNLGVTQITGPVLEETHYYPFGLTMSGISTTAPLRLEGKRKFNGIEFNHKEFSDGSGLDLYTAKFRGLDPQIGRWWQIDPKPDYAQSLYSAMNNNPISFNDPLGDTIRGTSNRSARRELRIIKRTFKGRGTKGLRKLFRRNGNTFAGIDKASFLKATANLSKDQRALAEGYMKAINSTNVHMVDVVKRGEKLSGLTASTLGIATNSTGQWVDNNAGGGLNTALGTGTLTVIVKNSVALIPDFIDASTGSYVSRTSSAGELSAHELLGHGLGREFGSPTFGHEDAIQMTNMYLRVTGNGNFYRNGTSHGTGVAIPMGIATGTPSYLQGTNNFFDILNSFITSLF